MYLQGMNKSVLANGADGGTANANDTAFAMYILFFFAQPQPTSCFSALEIDVLDIQSGCH